MVIMYRFTKATRNYRRFDAVNVPRGIIVGAIYLPLESTVDEFPIQIP